MPFNGIAISIPGPPKVGSILPANLSANPPDLYINLRTGQAWKKSTGAIVSAASVLSVARAAPATQFDTLNNLYQFGNNVLAQSNRGDSIWENRVGSLRNNTMAGSASSLPTFWSQASGSGITFNYGALITVGGVSYLPVTFSGTASGTTNLSIIFDGFTNTAALYGQTWSGAISLFASGASIPALSLNLSARNSGGSLAQDFTSSALAVTTTPTRFPFSATLLPSATAFLAVRLLIGVTSGQTYNDTLFIAIPQAENNSLILSGVASAAIAAAGSGGTDGTAVYQVGGGTGTAATLNVTVTGGVITAINSVASAGSYSVFPTSAAPLTYVSGTGSGVTGATVNLTPIDNSTRAAPSNPILTSAGTVTRSSEQTSVILTGLPAFTTSFTALVVATPRMPIASQNIQSMLELQAAVANRIALRRNSGTGVPLTAGAGDLGGPSITANGSPVWAQNARGKFIQAFAPGGSANSFNGSSVATSAVSFSTAPTTVLVGCTNNGAPSFFANGDIEEIGLWMTQRVPDGQLPGMTS